MVPTQYLVPDLMLEDSEEEEDAASSEGQKGEEQKKVLGKGKARPTALITDFQPHQLDLSAHLVTNEVRTKSQKQARISQLSSSS